MGLFQISATYGLLLGFNKQIISMFTKSREIKAVWDQTVVIISLQMIPDHWQTVLQGPIKGLGIQERVMPVTLFCYWGVNVPLSFYLTYHLQLGLKGLWASMIVTQSIIALAFLWTLARTDWHEVARKANQKYSLQ